MKYLSLIILLFSVHAVAKNIVPEQLTKVNLSNKNPNHIICVDGDINDKHHPAYIPIDSNSVGKNLFIAYKFKRNSQGTLEFVTADHVIHITCAGEVYSLNVNPDNEYSEKIYLGDDTAKQLQANASILKHKGIEDIISEMIIDAINNDLPPQYSVKRQSIVLPTIFNGLKIVQRRVIQLNGVGLQLKEYEIFSDSETYLSKKQFIRREFSNAMRAISIVNENPTPKKPSRLFIVEDKS